jgi:hypothetical protein
MDGVQTGFYGITMPMKTEISRAKSIQSSLNSLDMKMSNL